MDRLSGQNFVTTQLMNPFPGLRPFQTDEAHLFFGREGQSEEVLSNLSKNKFAAVLGASGTGKSSLIYCGLLPVLYGGFLHNDRSKWKIVVSRPGSDPVSNLAYSIAETFSPGGDKEQVSTDTFINHSLLKRSATGVSNVINQYGINSDENVLLLIDQFEELFRFQYADQSSQASNQVEHFVNLLVNAVKQTELPVYVVITMRSDFIGECSPYQDLTRLINDSHYLIPRMTRDDFRKAIIGPVAVGGAKITDQLVQLLLNEMGNNPDQLPILQHALMRTWNYWKNNCDTTLPLGINEYEAIGRLERALSNHSNEAFDELKVDEKKICEVIFKSLTEKGGDNRGVRRPTSIKELANISEANEAEVIKVVEIFRMAGRTFLTPSPGIELTADSIVDISHESLMRVWDKLKIWVEEESAAVYMYQRLANSAEMFHQGKTGLWGPPDLHLAINWRNKHNPNLAWAERYNPAFERTMVYLRTSEEEHIAEEENKIRLQKRALKRSRIVALILGTAGMISIALGILALMQRQDALKAQTKAEEQEVIAVEQASEAKRQKEIASKNEKDALVQKEIAENQKNIADEQTQIAIENLEETERQKLIAQQKSREALEQKQLAERSAKEALEQKQIAETASSEAERRRMISIAQSLAVKSQQMRTDTTLKGLLAYKGFEMNASYEGIPYDPDVFKALYSSDRLFNGKAHNMYDGHISIVRTFALNENMLYSAGSDGKLIGWNIQDKTRQEFLSKFSIIRKIFLYDNFLIGISNEGLFKFNLETKELTYKNNEIVYPKDLFIIHDNQLLIVFKNRISVVDMDFKSERNLYNSEQKISTAIYHKETNTLFAAKANGEILMWNNPSSGTSKPESFISGSESSWGALAYHPVKKQLIAGQANKTGLIYIWDIESRELQLELRGHSARISKIELSSDGNLMATASYDGSVRLWHLEDLKTLPVVFDVHESWVTALSFSKDNQYLYSGEKNGAIHKFPVKMEILTTNFCNYLSRDLSAEEWNVYIGEDIPYTPLKCKE